MKRELLDIRQMGVCELSMSELLTIDGGGFWNTLGIILGVATVVAALVLVGPVALIAAL
ncbi:MAG: hypothetical protein RL246_628 [Bacteroidota bacterium]|jgi:hypothetical protein